MSDEDRELQEKIARLESRIERHKSEQYTQDYGRPHSGWVPQRGTPYGSPRGRGRGRGHVPFQNRTLIINSNGQQQPGQYAASKPQTGGIENAPSTGWVSKRDRHMQLINTSVYEQKAQERSQAMAETRKQKQQQREEKEKTMLKDHISTLQNIPHNDGSTQQPTQQIFVKNIRFLVTAGGSKLVRAQDESTASQPTPKRTVVAGVVFYRSKHGNLYRAGIIHAKRSDIEDSPHIHKVYLADYKYSKITGVKKIDELCPKFTTTGSCTKGPLCRYLHDPQKVAICKDFLHKGECPAGADCDLSHNPSPERVPACLHFLRGNCTNPDCRYAHVRVNAAAPVCRAFATLGYCSKGSACTEKHVHECPDYTNKGICHNKKCRLPHVDRAGQLRKAAARQDEDEDIDASSDISSDEEYGRDSDDIDSDEFEDEIIEATDNHELSQQNDYVTF